MALNNQHQACLCLSCGVPFLPSADEVDLFSSKANLSILYLHLEFKKNPTLQRTHQKLKFSGTVHGSHLFHDSHHITALRYMTQKHTGDSPVAWPPQAGKVRLPCYNQKQPHGLLHQPQGNESRGECSSVAPSYLPHAF